MSSTRKQLIQALLKGIETGDPESVVVVDQDRYIQHNPQTEEGGEGLAELFARLSKTNPRVNIVRIFSDGDYVFGHTEYFFSKARVGFEVFRFEGDRAVEHWDNIQSRKGPNPDGRSMVDGATEVTDLDKTEENRAFVSQFLDEVMIAGDVDRIDHFFIEDYVEHNPRMSGGLPALKDALRAQTEIGPRIHYRIHHRVLADGNFVLSVCEGEFDGVHTSFYDLFRVQDGKIVEHWDTTEAVPPRDVWKNENGKF